MSSPAAPSEFPADNYQRVSVSSPVAPSVFPTISYYRVSVSSLAAPSEFQQLLTSGSRCPLPQLPPNSQQFLPSGSRCSNASCRTWWCSVSADAVLSLLSLGALGCHGSLLHFVGVTDCLVFLLLGDIGCTCSATTVPVFQCSRAKGFEALL